MTAHEKEMEDALISPSEFEEEMRHIAETGKSIELKHRRADILMMTVLCQLGYEKGVEVFDEMNKWYA